MSYPVDFHATVAAFTPVTYFLEVQADKKNSPRCVQIATYVTHPTDRIIQIAASPFLSLATDLGNIDYHKRAGHKKMFVAYIALSPLLLPGKCLLRTVESIATRSLSNIIHFAFPANTFYAVYKGGDYAKEFLVINERILQGNYLDELLSGVEPHFKRIPGNARNRICMEFSAKGWRILPKRSSSREDHSKESFATINPIGKLTTPMGLGQNAHVPKRLLQTGKNVGNTLIDAMVYTR